MSRAEILMWRCRYCHSRIRTHLISATHVVAHLHLGILLTKVVHLTVIRRVVILTIIMVWRRIMTVRMPIKRVVAVVGVAHRRVTTWCYWRWWSCNDARGVAPQRCQIAIVFVGVRHLRWLFFDVDDWWRHRRRWSGYSCRCTHRW